MLALASAALSEAAAVVLVKAAAAVPFSQRVRVAFVFVCSKISREPRVAAFPPVHCHRLHHCPQKR